MSRITNQIPTIETDSVKPAKKSSTIASKKSCAPARAAKFDGISCYNLTDLQKLARAFNKKNKNKIPINKDKKALWKNIKDRMNSKCNTESCWLDVIMKKDNNDIFRPRIPKGKYEFLTTDDITFVLKQYQALDPTFRSMGAMPIDFNKVIPAMKSFKFGNKQKWGFVFNTHPHNKGGEHWIGMYMHIFKSKSDSQKPSYGTIDYFDSYGKTPPPPQVQALIKRLIKQGAEKGIKFSTNYNKIRHQRKGSECGVYAINFIVNRLAGVPFAKVSTHIINDDKMNQMRKTYFRPIDKKK